jgi:hypothetical protein
MLRAAILVTVVALLLATPPIQVAHAGKLPAHQESCDNSEDPACGPITTNDEEHDDETEQPDAPVVTTIYVTETIVVEEIVTIEQIVPVTETVYVEKVVTVVVTEVVPVEEIVTIEQIVPVTETVYVEEVVTTVVTEVIPVEQIVPVTETVYVEEVVTVVVTEVAPVEQIVVIEQIVPVTETIYVTDVVRIEQIVPVTQTIFVTETITPQPAPSPTSSPTLLPYPTPLPSTATDSVTTTTGITTSQTISVILEPSAPLRHWSQLSPPYDTASPLPITGLAMYYAPNIMDGVEAYRERVNGMAECEECVGQVALLRAGDLGRKVWIKVGEGAVEGPFHVLDVAARHHIPDLLRRNWVVDVDYTTAVRWGMQGPMMVTVYETPPTPQTVMQSATSAELTPQ